MIISTAADSINGGFERLTEKFLKKGESLFVLPDSLVVIKITGNQTGNKYGVVSIFFKKKEYKTGYYPQPCGDGDLKTSAARYFGFKASWKALAFYLWQKENRGYFRSQEGLKV